MKAANEFIFFKEINNGITVDFDLTDRKLKRFCFVKGEKTVNLSANHLDHSFDLVYACFEKGNHVCSDNGAIPETEIYNVITAIVNDFLG